MKTHSLKVLTLMKRKPSRKSFETMCGQPSPEDGLDPRDYFKPTRQRRDTRKDWQLCRQVFETLNYVLSGDGHDDVLQGLLVSEVAPAPDATRMLVTVQSLDAVVDPTAILQSLQLAMGRLRAEVARSISRRKVPELAFQVFLPSPPTSMTDGGEA
ncbi:MAG: ribosome-binding factor [Schlesneria sp.]|nr:ribosome-binding factor [Schlesneria sp.]